MRISRTTVCWSLVFFLATPCFLHAQEKNTQDMRKSCRDFVQGFYDWYVPKTLKDNPGNTSDLALKYKSHAFSPELLRQLKEDSAAQAKVPGEIVGLDSDPYLNSQDPGERYVAGKITTKGDRCWVEVYGIWSGKKSEKPNVVPELMLKDVHWVFVNFHYPEFGDLLSILKNLREGRRKHSN